MRHILHPVRSARTLCRIGGTYVYGLFAERRFRFLRRGRRDRCWCGGELLSLKRYARYGVCADCGCYVNQQPLLPEQLKEFYSYNLYWRIRQKSKGYAPIEKRGALYRSDGRLRYWLSLVEKFAKAKRDVIEVGCAPGVLLHELHKRGHRCIGVEVDEKVANWIEQNMDVEVRAGVFPGMELPNCELFLSFDVLEHIHAPDRFMNRVAHLLEPGGVAIIQTPIERKDYKRPFAGRPDFFDDLEHLVLFTDRAVLELGSRAGLEVLHIGDAPYSLGGICVFRKR